MNKKQNYYSIIILSIVLLNACKPKTIKKYNLDINKKSNNLLSLNSLKTVIRTKDFKKSKWFYGELFNLSIIEEYDDEDGSKGCIFKLNENALIEISEITKENSYYDKSFDELFENSKMGIQIKTDSVDFWAQRLKGKYTARGPVKRPWGPRYLYLRDPDSLEIIIYQENK